MKSSNSTVLMVFSFSANLEAKAKPIFGKKNTQLSFQLQDFLISKVKELVRNVDIPVVWYNEELQVGASFGERYSQAFQELFDKGYEKVISIGNDCPQLTSEHIKKACLSLNESDTVWGPSCDGGVYLLGLSKRAFDKRTFQNLPWQTSELLSKLISEYGALTGSGHSMPKLFDIDNVCSLKKLISKGKFAVLKHIFDLFLIGFITKISTNNTYFTSNYFALSQFQRGPPVL